MFKNLLCSDNYIDFLDKNTNLSRLKVIQLGYELQAGSYEKNYNYNNLMQKRVKILINNINNILDKNKFCNILEVGIGEGNTMRHLIENIDKNILNKINFYGIELSFSRLKICKKHIPNCNLFVSDMNNLPFDNNIFDIVYTASSIEPNIDNEENILKELYRICKYRIILFEISYKDASINLKNRFTFHKYIKYLYETIKKLKYNLIEYNELETTDTYNNYLYLIEKDINVDMLTDNIDIKNKLISPIFNDKLEYIIYNNSKFYKSLNLNLHFPIIDEIPILLIDNAIIIT